MRMIRTLYLAALTAAAIAVPSIAQVQNPPAATGLTPQQQAQVDQATADAAAARTAVLAAATPAQIDAAITAATPATCPMPQSDTYTGTAGSGTRCMPRDDAARRTQVQSTTATTASDGTFAGNWAVAFVSTPMYAHAEINSATTPFVCSIITTSATGYTGKCFAVASTTLPGTLLALNGLVVSPIVNASAGQTVRIIARQ